LYRTEESLAARSDPLAVFLRFVVRAGVRIHASLKAQAEAEL
jgi:hypothetical protein